MPSSRRKSRGSEGSARTCELLEVSKAAYYQSLKAEPSTRARTDAELAKVIAEVHQVSDGTYGSPRVQAELAQRGIACGRRRVARLMRLAGLEGRCKRRWRTTTVPGADEQKALDLIKRHFGPSAEIDTRYVGDITYSAQLAVMCSPGGGSARDHGDCRSVWLHIIRGLPGMRGAWSPGWNRGGAGLGSVSRRSTASLAARSASRY